MENKTYAIKVKAQPLPLFETPIGFGELSNADALLDDLTAAISAKKVSSAGIKRSNEGGWHSETDMLEWGGAAAQKVAETAISVAKRMSHFEGVSVDDFEWTATMWANVTPANGLNALHSHPGNLWAAVLYLDMGEEFEGKGRGDFFDDGAAQNDLLDKGGFFDCRTRGAGQGVVDQKIEGVFAVLVAGVFDLRDDFGHQLTAVDGFGV